MSAFLGMSKFADWPDGARPKNWREGILWLYPNGRAPLTGLSSLMKKESTDDYEFSWFTQTFPDQSATLTAIYTGPGLTNAYAGSGVAGQTLNVQMAEADADEFRVGHGALVFDKDNFITRAAGKVVNVVKNGASSYVAVKLLEADDNGSGGTYNDLRDADSIFVMGNINPQGGVTPASISYQPTKFYNYTQIFRTPLELARTMMKTKSRTGNTYQNLKQMALELHGFEMEKAFHFGVATENTGENGQKETTTEGLVTFLASNLSAHVRNYKTNSDYAGKTWLEGGDDFILDSMELLSRYKDEGNGNYIIYAGSGALKHIERLAKNGTMMNIGPAQKVGYGLEVASLKTSFGDWALQTHAWYSQETALRNCMLILKPGNLRYRYVDDTKFYGQQGKEYGYTASGKKIDGLNEEFLTEAGMEYHHPQTAMFLSNLGDTNTTS